MQVQGVYNEQGAPVYYNMKGCRRVVRIFIIDLVNHIFRHDSVKYNISKRSRDS